MKTESTTMDKFIFTSSSQADLIGLLKNTKVAYKKAKWDPSTITRSEEKADCDGWSLYCAVEDKDWEKVDNYIMSGDVPVGGLVVTCDGDESPVYGYVCGNGNEWFRIFLPKNIIDAVMEFYPPIKYGVRQGLSIKRFKTRKELEKWVKQGYRETDGSEQDHYIHMLAQLEEGLDILEYDD